MNIELILLQKNGVLSAICSEKRVKSPHRSNEIGLLHLKNQSRFDSEKKYEMHLLILRLGTEFPIQNFDEGQ